MRKYIALLRGVNVGGNNKLSMPALKAVWEEHGFVDVRTYINSGNIIFSSSDIDEESLMNQCKVLIAEKFGLNIPVSVVSEKSLTEALVHAPAWWNKDKEAKHNAIFVIPPASVEEIYEAVGKINPEYETVSHYGRVIFWSAPLKTFSRTRWSKITGTSVYNYVTIRNANTANKLLTLIKE